MPSGPIRRTDWATLNCPGEPADVDRSARGSEAGVLGVARGLYMQGDLNLVADYRAAGLQQRVPGESEVLPVDRRLRRETGPVQPVGIGDLALVGGIQGYGLGHAPGGQAALPPVLTPPSLLHAL